MASVTESFEVSVNENPSPSRLLLSDGMAMLIDNEFSSHSFILEPGKLKIDFHEDTGHLRFTKTQDRSDFSVVLRVLPRSNVYISSASIPGAERLSSSTNLCLKALHRFFKRQNPPEVDLTTRLSPIPDYQAQPGLNPKNSPSTSPMPSESLKIVPSVPKDWIIARVTGNSAGTPSTGFTVMATVSESILASLTSSSAPSSSSGSLHSSTTSDPSKSMQSSTAAPDLSASKSTPPKSVGPLPSTTKEPLVRVRLYPSFASLGAKLKLSNPKIPSVPSNWRRDQLVLQQELDAWLHDALVHDPTHPDLIAFISDEDDAFVSSKANVASSGMFGMLGSMMEAKPYIPQFPIFATASSPTSKSLTLVFGDSGSGKSAFINHIIGYPVCYPSGSTPQKAGLCATFYEVLPPAEFCKVANFKSYWTHHLQFDLVKFPPGTEYSVASPDRLQEPIIPHSTSWKAGSAFVLLNHKSTLERYRFASELSHITCHTCIVSEATLDPLRLEYDIAKSNIFVEFNNFEHLTNDFGETVGALVDPEPAETQSEKTLSQDEGLTRESQEDFEDDVESSDFTGTQEESNESESKLGESCEYLASPPRKALSRSRLETSQYSPPKSWEDKLKHVTGAVPSTATLPVHLLEVAHFLSRTSRILHFGSLESLPRIITDGWMLEIAELLCANKNTFQFTTHLATWIHQATSTVHTRDHESKVGSSDFIRDVKTEKRSLDLLKLLSLMQNWLNLLPTPRRPRHLLFLAPDRTIANEVANEKLLTAAPFFKIHNVLASSARVLTTTNPDQLADSANLVVSVNQSDPISASATSSHVPVYEYLVPSDSRDSLFINSLLPRTKT